MIEMQASDFPPGTTAHEADGTIWVRAWHYGDPWWVSEHWVETPYLDRSDIVKVERPVTTWTAGGDTPRR